MTDTKPGADEAFDEETRAHVDALGQDAGLRALSLDWLTRASRHKYSHNFTWLGRPIIQLPQDILAMQEIVWEVRPDLIVETGVARGGSMVLYASLLELLGGDGLVVGVDIEVRNHNRAAIEAHPMFRRIRLIEGSSLDPGVVEQVRVIAAHRERVLVVLDSNHTHEHVRRELEVYSPLVTLGSYLVVFDTVVEDLPEGFFPDRPWSRGNNPKTAVAEFLQATDRFEVDQRIESKILITVAPGGYLRRVKA